MGIRARIALAPASLAAAIVLVGCPPTALLTAVSLHVAGDMETPVFTDAGGAYVSGHTFEITEATGGATIYYTTEGSDPTPASTVYAGPLTLPIDSTTTVKAVAVKTGMGDPTVASATYTMVRRISTIVGTGTAGYSGDGRPATSAQLKNPIAVAVDNLGNLFVIRLWQPSRP